MTQGNSTMDIVQNRIQNKATPMDSYYWIFILSIPIFILSIFTILTDIAFGLDFKSMVYGTLIGFIFFVYLSLGYKRIKYNFYTVYAMVALLVQGLLLAILGILL